MKCPTCGSEQVNPPRISGRNLCLNCGHIFNLDGKKTDYWTDKNLGTWDAERKVLEAATSSRRRGRG